MTSNSTDFGPLPSEATVLRGVKRSCVERDGKELSNLQYALNRTDDCEVVADRVNLDGHHVNNQQSNKLRRIVTDEGVIATTNADKAVSSTASFPTMLMCPPNLPVPILDGPTTNIIAYQTAIAQDLEKDPSKSYKTSPSATPADTMVKHATPDSPSTPPSAVPNPNVTTLPDEDHTRKYWVELSKCDLTESKNLINELMKHTSGNFDNNLDRESGDIDMKESMSTFVRKNILQRMNICTQRYEKEMKELQRELYDFNQQAMDPIVLPSTSNSQLLGTNPSTSGSTTDSSASMILSKMVSDTTSTTKMPAKLPAKRRRKAEEPNSAPRARAAAQNDTILTKEKFNDINHQKKFITTPTKEDVLGGRGNGPNKHEGNKKFRALVQKFKIEYINAYTDRDKKTITLQIMDSIKSNGGRFLKKHTVELGWNVVVWEEMDFNSVLKKVGQALRENAPDIRNKKASQPFQLEAVSALMSLGT